MKSKKIGNHGKLLFGQKSLFILLQCLNTIRNNIWKLFKAVTIGVRVIAIRNENEILLVKHTYKNHRLWSLPGGGVKAFESLKQTAQRELLEETGVQINDPVLLDIITDLSEGRSDHVAIYYGRIIIEEYQSCSEIQQAKFFEIEKLPENILPISKEGIKLLKNIIPPKC